MWCSGVPGEEFIAALWATMPGAAERPTGRPAVGGESQDRLYGVIPAVRTVRAAAASPVTVNRGSSTVRRPHSSR